MPAFIDMSGSTFGRLTVIDLDTSNKSVRVKWNCVCACGTTKSIEGAALRRGATVSCGCFGIEQASKKITTHGHSRAGGPKQATYKIWTSMLQRCNNPKSQKFKRYGGRGIRVSHEWHLFANFISDLGERPDGFSLDRIDNNGNYCKENCRWASPITQSHNRENNRMINFRGESMCISEWARHTGLSVPTLTGRINAGWDIERALLSPVKRINKPT